MFEKNLLGGKIIKIILFICKHIISVTRICIILEKLHKSSCSLVNFKKIFHPAEFIVL